MSDESAKLIIGDQTVEFPILDGSVGPRVIDIRKLYAETGMFTYDPGYTSTGSCQSNITYIDGEQESCSIAAIRSSSWRNTVTSWKSATCCCMANFRQLKKKPSSIMT